MRRQARRRAADAAFAGAHEDLLVLLTVLRGASTESLHALHFSKQPAPTTLRQTYRDMHRLERIGLLERQYLEKGRCVWRLTAKGHASSPRVQRRAAETIRRPMSDLVGGYCWLRSALWAELANRGYRVGRGVEEQHAVRRFLIDKQRAVVRAASGAAREAAERVLQTLRADRALLPLFRSICPKCGTASELRQIVTNCPRCTTRVNQVPSAARYLCARCGHESDRAEPHQSRRVRARRCEGTMREVDYVDFDVAWRPAGSTFEVVLIVVDDAQRSIRRQLDVLPLRTLGQPKVPVVLRTTDHYSVLNSITCRWHSTGPRHLALLRAFTESGDRHLFPFSLTAEVIDVRPELQLRIRPYREENSHA